ncbi:hypothetical protein BGX31_008272, partial [Mortierella sp. GBA43]
GQDPAQGKDPDVFWDELFLIKVNEGYLSSSLQQTSEDQLLAIKDGINNIFLHATLTIVLGEIFRKKFNNWSFDVIHLLTGLSHADNVFRTLVEGLDTTLGSEDPLEIRTTALRLAITLACGNDNVNKNSLNEYFMQRNLFPSLIKFFLRAESTELAFEVMALLGLLANYNKYEIQNPYLSNLTELNNAETFQKMVMVTVHTFDGMRGGYTKVMDDDEMSTVSKLTSALSYVTGMLWNPKAQDNSVTDTAFALLPDGRVTVLLILYDLIYNNKRFRQTFLDYTTKSLPTASQGNINDKPTEQQQQLGSETSETGLGAFLSFASYLLQHNRTHRSSPYTHLCLIILQILVEDPTTYPYLCTIPQSQDLPSILTVSAEGARATSAMAVVRLCRQRQPVIPNFKQPRPMAAVLLDVILGFLKHNMKKKMQIDCFRLSIAIIFSLASRFKALRVRLPYHWAEMWNGLQNFVKFLQSNGKAFEHNLEARDLVAETIDLVNYFVTFGDLIMPDPASLYSLYYEIVRSGIDPFLDLTRQFSISVQPPLPPPLPHHDLTSRNRLNLVSSPTPTPPESALPSPSPGSVSVMSTSPTSTFQYPPYRPLSPLSAASSTIPQRVIIIDLSNINQVYTFFFSHLLTWRDSNPTRSLGPDLVSTIIKDHYQDLTLIPIPLDAFLTQRQNVGNGVPNSSSSAFVRVSGPHPAWDGYSEVPTKVHFFRQLTRWVVADLRTITKQHVAAASAAPKSPTTA